MDTMLCVVDVQYPFVQPEDHAYIEAILQAIEQAKNEGHYIALIEDNGGSVTDDRVRQALNGYGKLIPTLRKGQWDGSLQVAIAVTDMKLNIGCYRLCGAFAEQCVLATGAGLRDRFYQADVEILRSASVPVPVRRFTNGEWERVAKRLRIKVS